MLSEKYLYVFIIFFSYEENKALNSLKTGSDKIKDASKKALGKLNTDSKLTDFIKKKMSK